jgi:hypothetical protein
MSKQIGGHEMKELAKMVQKQILGLDFCLIVFEFHKSGMSNYISNAQRADMITALKETIVRLESGQDFKTPEPN